MGWLRTALQTVIWRNLITFCWSDVSLQCKFRRISIEIPWLGTFHIKLSLWCIWHSASLISPHQYSSFSISNVLVLCLPRRKFHIFDRIKNPQSAYKREFYQLFSDVGLVTKYLCEVSAILQNLQHGRHMQIPYIKPVICSLGSGKKYI